MYVNNFKMIDKKVRQILT